MSGFERCPGCAFCVPELGDALALLEDGASYTEAAKTIGRSRSYVSEHLPGYGWTQKQGGAYGGMIRHMNERMRKI